MTGEVAEVEERIDDTRDHFQNAVGCAKVRKIKGEIVSVVSMDVYESCVSCSSKVLVMGFTSQCTKCGAVQKVGKIPKRIVITFAI